ncbi:T9SS type A sorting domain-containing protein [bacterium]|nr:T9SS type A sorting domain-containing protein [bacterium]
MKRLLYIFVFLSLSAIFSVASAHFGAKYEPPDGQLYHGVGWNYRESVRLYSEMFPDDHHPLILQVNTALPGIRDMNVERVIAGLTNPIFHPDSQYIEYSLHFTRDGVHMLDSVFALTDELDNYIDTLEIAFNRVDRPFFLRIGFEFNGNWNPYHPFIYPLAFRKLVEELRDRGIDNFATVWCYEPDAGSDFADSNRAGWKWYPGDDVVDWFGIDPFDVAGFDPDLPDSISRGDLRNITKKGKTELFLSFARERRKPVFLNELSAVRLDITPDEEDADSVDGIRDWESFFVPFFEFLDNHPEIKGLNYIDIDWTQIDQYRELGWRDARLEINSYIRNRWVAALVDDSYINAGYDISQHASVPNEVKTIPDEFDISVYPNPFNSIFTVSYNLNGRASMDLKLYSIGGIEVWSSSGKMQNAGQYQVTIDCSGLASGVYLLRLETANATSMQKVALIR